MQIMRRKNLEITDKNEIEGIIKRCRIIHIAMANDSEPYIVTVNFGFEIDDQNRYVFYFHSAAEGKKIEMLRKNPRVCLSCECSAELKNAQTACECSYAYECIVATGMVHEVADLQEKARCLALLTKHQTGRDFEIPPKKTQNVFVGKIIVTSLTAKRHG